MMSGSAFSPIQQAIHNKLTADSTLMAKVTGVFDFVQDNQSYPYIVIGEGTSVPMVTFDRFGEEATTMIHIWSRYQGFKETADIMDDLNRLLAHQDLTMDGYDTITCFYDFSETLREPDGITFHAVVRYRILTQKQ